MSLTAPWRTLRGRLLLLALLVEGLMLIIMIGNSLRLLRNEMGEQAREQAEQIAPVLSAALIAPLAQFDYATVQAVLDESHAIQGIDYLAVSDSGGNIVAASGWPTDKALPPVDATFSIDDPGDTPRYDLARTIHIGSQTLGTLQFGLDLKRIVTARRNLLTQAVLIAASELLLSAGLLALLGLLITRQLSVLTQASLKVAKGELLPAPVVPEGNDELGRLGAAFNVMSGAIQDRIDQLTRANEATQRMAEALKESHLQLQKGNEALHFENQIRIETQHELELALGRIREQTEQLKAIFDLSPDGFVSFDGQHRVKYASPAYLHMLGLRPDQVIGLSEDGFSTQLAAQCEGSARFPGISGLQVKSSPAGCRGAQGQRQLIELTAGKRILEVTLRCSESESVSKILYFRDVTHETEVDRMKSDFLSHAAHELRTPMASIFGFAELLLAIEFAPDEQKEYLGTIYRQSELMVSIINELLDLARIEERRGKDFDFSDVDAAQLMQQVIADYKPPAGRPAATLQAAEPLPRVRADSSKLMQAFRNVLSNAYKYSPAGGAVDVSLARVDLGATSDGPSCLVEIRFRDHGIGMSPEQLAQVGDRFYRADASGNIPGTGLGMSIVKEIIALHGGQMQLSSELGAGTTVSLRLPASVGPA